MYDIAIIGAGPAGLSAAITARARDKSVVVVSNKPQESPLAKAQIIDNYPGMPQVSGLHLLEQMLAHARALGAELRMGRAVSVLPVGDGFSVSTGSESIDARAVILAIGTQAAKPFVGEADYLGRGVSYCATCDGMLYRTSSVCVVGLNSEAVEEANFLAGLGAQVTFLAKAAPVGLANGITFVQGTVAKIQGDPLGVTAVVYKPTRQKGQRQEGDDSFFVVPDADAEVVRDTTDAQGADAVRDAADALKTLSCNGVFILRPSLAPDALIGTVALANGHIAVDAEQQTNIPGLFAAGDCTGKPYQISRATGDAQSAVLAAVKLLD
ncbi:MAG: NAD(P)/FAD-dependent oxidoreductase [Coriobacteriales bacterium]|jgi:thioredoxin reductase (NADPH)|nr:NAD(P)/FAD-dependent oxidoreductase [Coriobacteriales bacterium]